MANLDVSVLTPQDYNATTLVVRLSMAASLGLDVVNIGQPRFHSTSTRRRLAQSGTTVSIMVVAKPSSLPSGALSDPLGSVNAAVTSNFMNSFANVLSANAASFSAQAQTSLSSVSLASIDVVDLTPTGAPTVPPTRSPSVALPTVVVDLAFKFSGFPSQDLAAFSEKDLSICRMALRQTLANVLNFPIAQISDVTLTPRSRRVLVNSVLRRWLSSSDIVVASVRLTGLTAAFPALAGDIVAGTAASINGQLNAFSNSALIAMQTISGGLSTTALSVFAGANLDSVSAVDSTPTQAPTASPTFASPTSAPNVRATSSDAQGPGPGAAIGGALAGVLVLSGAAFYIWKVKSKSVVAPDDGSAVDGGGNAQNF